MVNTMESPVEIGDHITVTIKRVLPLGLVVSLPDGKHGLIRKRELSWGDEQSAEALEHYHPDEAVTAVVLHKHEKLVELSARLCEHDPWDNIQTHYWPKQWVDGVVTGIASYGIFVQLEPGVTGLLHRSQIPYEAEIKELFWIGDLVYVSILHIDKNRRQIELTLEGFEQWRLQQKASGVKEGRQHPKPPRDAPLASPLPLDIITHSSPKRIFLVEDDPDQQDAINHWLADAGQDVTTFVDAETALQELTSISPDLLLVDMRLPGEMNGLDLVRTVRQAAREPHCVLMSDWVSVQQHLDELTRLRDDGFDVLIKPIRPDDLYGLLANRYDTHRALLTGEESIDAIVQFEPVQPETQKWETTLHKEMVRMRRRVRASKVTLFKLDPYQRQISVVAEVGGNPIPQIALSDLIHSPVREVAEDGQIVIIHDIDAAGRYAAKLRPAVNLSACVGFPLSATDAMYALFVFFKKPGAITADARDKLEGYSALIGALLKEKRLTEWSASMQRVALAGYVTQMLVHELNHYLSPMLLEADSLGEWCRQARQSLTSDPERMELELVYAAEKLDRLKTYIDGLTDQVRLFGRLAIEESEGIRRVDRIIERAITLVDDQARGANVDIHYSPRLMVSQLKGVHILQILLNTLFNAIQQISLFRGYKGGRIDIITQRILREGQPWIQITIADDGPGIHHRHWERIFDLGFTTREGEDSGLGLYLSRQLLRNMGGDISVATSHMLWGSSFEILLPVSIGGEGD